MGVSYSFGGGSSSGITSQTITMSVSHNVTFTMSGITAVTINNIVAIAVSDSEGVYGIQYPPSNVKFTQYGDTARVTVDFSSSAGDDSISLYGEDAYNLNPNVNVTILYSATPNYTSTIYTYTVGSGHVQVKRSGKYFCHYGIFTGFTSEPNSQERDMAVRRLSPAKLLLFSASSKPNRTIGSGTGANGPWGNEISGEVLLDANDTIYTDFFHAEVNDSGGTLSTVTGVVYRQWDMRWLAPLTNYQATVTFAIT